MHFFSDALIKWFLHSMRNLPWRQTREPYPVWISEIILQQTRVQQGMDYYLRFMERFPDVVSLAEASEEEVLSLWQGLGYYSRARNLHHAARQIQTSYNGVFPDSYAGLQKLKGVGSYTAAAIASFAFEENVPVVDGNVLRVVCRHFGIPDDIRLPATQEKVRQICAELLPPGKSWEFNQAIMELGALVCTPSGPDCRNCPLAAGCSARKENRQKELPFKSKAKARRHRFFNYLLLECDGFLAFRKREEGDIWSGLYEPLLYESSRVFDGLNDFPEIPKEIILNLRESRLLPPEKCILSHQEIHVRVWFLSLDKRIETDGIRWVSGTGLEALPKPVIFSKILRKAKTSPLSLIF